MTSFIISLAVRLTILLLAGGLAVLAVRRSPSAVRHVVIAATLVCVIVLPITMLLVPEWRVAMLPSEQTTPVAIAAPAVQTTSIAATPSIRPVLITSYRDIAPTPSLSRTIGPAHTMSVPQIALAIWLFGVAVGLLWLAAGRWGLARVRRRAVPLDTADWRAILDAECSNAGITRGVTLLASEMVSTPVTWGIMEPVIVLPEAALVWSDERRRVVLMHELAHIARRDCATQLLASLACIVYWIHPLVLVAARRLRAECERACDERVLELGTPATDYAAHLLDVARYARSLGAANVVSVAMARPSELEGRLLAVLRAKPHHGSASVRSRVAGTLMAACALVAVSAFKPVAKAASLTSARLVTHPRILNGEYSSASVDLERPAPREARKINLSATIVTGAKRFDSTFEKSVPAKEGGTLILDLDTGGDIDITVGDDSKVTVNGSIGGTSWHGTRINFDSQGDDARLTTRFEGRSGNESFDNSFSIRVPKRYNVRIKSAGGGVSITGVEGSFSGMTGGGEIRIDDAKGDAHLTTGGGDVRVTKSHLDGSIETGGGTVKLQGVTGDLVGNSGSDMRGMEALGNMGDMRDFDSPKFKRKYARMQLFKWDDSAMRRFKMDDSMNMHFKWRSDDGKTWRRFESDSGDYDSMQVDTLPMTIIIDTMVIQHTRDAMRQARDALERNRDAMDRARVLMDRDRVSMERIGNMFVLKKDGGEITLSDVPDRAHVVTGGGAIVIGRSAGRVLAETGGGNITIDAAEGDASVTTGAGNVLIKSSGKDAHSVDVSSGSGSVVLQLPDNANATLDLETAYTNENKPSKIVSDWPVKISVSPDWDSSHGTPRKYVRVHQDIGKGGATIRVRTVNGDIQLKREH